MSYSVSSVSNVRGFLYIPPSFLPFNLFSLLQRFLSLAIKHASSTICWLHSKIKCPRWNGKKKEKKKKHRFLSAPIKSISLTLWSWRVCSPMQTSFSFFSFHLAVMLYDCQWAPYPLLQRGVLWPNTFPTGDIAHYFPNLVMILWSYFFCSPHFFC